MVYLPAHHIKVQMECKPPLWLTKALCVPPISSYISRRPPTLKESIAPFLLPLGLVLPSATVEGEKYSNLPHSWLPAGVEEQGKAVKNLLDNIDPGAVYLSNENVVATSMEYIQVKAFELVDVIGFGANGVVFRAVEGTAKVHVHMSTRETYAVPGPPSSWLTALIMRNANSNTRKSGFASIRGERFMSAFIGSSSQHRVEMIFNTPATFCAVKIKSLPRSPIVNTGRDLLGIVLLCSGMRRRHSECDRVVKVKDSDLDVLVSVSPLYIGSSWKLCLNSPRGLPVQTTAWILSHVSRNLVEMHPSETNVVGLIHGDIKPQNVLIDDEATPQIIDFDCARMASLTDGILPCISGIIGGSVVHASPEFAGYLLGSPCQCRLYASLDIWSLGVTAVEYISGKPFYSTLTFRGVSFESSDTYIKFLHELHIFKIHPDDYKRQTRLFKFDIGCSPGIMIEGSVCPECSNAETSSLLDLCNKVLVPWLDSLSCIVLKMLSVEMGHRPDAGGVLNATKELHVGLKFNTYKEFYVGTTKAKKLKSSS